MAQAWKQRSALPFKHLSEASSCSNSCARTRHCCASASRCRRALTTAIATAVRRSSGPAGRGAAMPTKPVGSGGAADVVRMVSKWFMKCPYRGPREFAMYTFHALAEQRCQGTNLECKSSCCDCAMWHTIYNTCVGAWLVGKGWDVPSGGAAADCGSGRGGAYEANGSACNWQGVSVTHTRSLEQRTWTSTTKTRKCPDVCTVGQHMATSSTCHCSQCSHPTCDAGGE